MSRWIVKIRLNVLFGLYNKIMYFRVGGGVEKLKNPSGLRILPFAGRFDDRPIVFLYKCEFG